MKTKLALIGFGTVGQGLCEILVSRREYLKQQYGLEWEVVAISDLLKGAVFNSQGLDVPAILELARLKRSIEEFTGTGEVQKGWDALTTIQNCNADIVCELTYTDIQTGQPATEHCRTALQSGKHVVTSNKGPAALFYHELEETARQNHVRFLIEGTVMSGTPVLNLVRNELAGNRITAVHGILNGTTNFILTHMEAGRPYQEALKEAQELGYAEADPTADVEGYDALAKVTILANVVMGEALTPDQIPCTGITGITLEDINQAKRENQRWKLIGEVKRQGGSVSASVQPQKIPLSHPLAGVNGAVNAITFTTDLLGEVTVVGAGAGKIETGFSILSDILEIHRNAEER